MYVIVQLFVQKNSSRPLHIRKNCQIKTVYGNIGKIKKLNHILVWQNYNNFRFWILYYRSNKNIFFLPEIFLHVHTVCKDLQLLY